MREIRPLTDKDWEAAVAISLDAYPGIKAQPGKLRERYLSMATDPIISFYGLFENEALLGLMRLYDFSMRLLSIDTLVGGVGGVAVDFLHKKEKIAYELLQYFLRHYREKSACLTALYPFRPDFYKQMGFGYGRKMNQYRVSPASLPKGVSKANVQLLTPSTAHRAAFTACYERYRLATNGLMAAFPYWLNSIINTPAVKVAACWQGAEIQGFIIFSFEQIDAKNFLRNEINIRAMVYETPQALSQLLAFLHSQADQIETIVFNTQEEDFHLVLDDPRNDSRRLLTSVYHETNTQGAGLMLRVIDVSRLFQVLRHHDFGGQTCRVKLTVSDSFLPENAGTWLLVVADGRLHLEAAGSPYDVALSLDVAEFSALLTGAVEFHTLARLGLAQLSDAAYAAVIQKMFYTELKPICMTSF